MPQVMMIMISLLYPDENIQTAHHSSTNAIQSSEVVKKMSDFDAANATNPLFTVFHQYMLMVMEMFAFIQAVRSGDWKLHLMALEFFTKYFLCTTRSVI